MRAADLSRKISRGGGGAGAAPGLIRVKPNSDEQFGKKRWFHNVFFTNDKGGAFVFSGFYGTD